MAKTDTLRKALSEQPTPEKAREMLKNPPRGKALTTKQRGYFGLLASGKSPTRSR